jgi:transcriptional regulator with XRE-family HTH domain
MTYPPYMREKARQLRRNQQLTIDEIAERLAVSRTTVFFWIGDMPRPARCRKRKGTGHALGNAAMQAKYRRLRERAYEEGVASFDSMREEEGFTDFVTLFIAEGYKRNRNLVSVANSDAAVIAIADRWLRRLSRNKLTYWVQYHADQDLPSLQRFWAGLVGVDADEIRLLRKSNSNQLKGRTWRSEHGVLTVTTHDTYFRAKLQAWVDLLRRRWLDSAPLRHFGA